MNRQTRGLLVALSLLLGVLGLVTRTAVASEGTVQASVGQLLTVPVTRPVTTPREIPSFTLSGRVSVRYPKRLFQSFLQVLSVGKHMLTAKNTATGKEYTTFTGRTGEYSFVLPRAAYVISITPASSSVTFTPNTRQVNLVTNKNAVDFHGVGTL